MGAREDLEANLPPDELVPGDLAGTTYVAANCGAFAERLADARRGIQYIELHGSDWTGEAADVYFAVKEADVALLQVAADAFDTASSALSTYATALEDARTQAAEAREEYQQARQLELECEPTAPVAPLGAPTVVGHPSGGTAAAVAKLEAARTAVKTAASEAASALKGATELAPIQVPQLGPQEAGPGLKDVVTAPWHLLHGFGKAMGGALTSMPDWFSPPGAPQYGSGEQGMEDSREGWDETANADLTLGSLALLLGGLRAGAGLRGASLRPTEVSAPGEPGVGWKAGDAIETPAALKARLWGSPAQRENWLREYLDTPGNTRPAQGHGPALEYQKATAGPTEVNLATSDGRTKIWGDGVHMDPDKVVAVDSKYVQEPGTGRSMYERGAPDFLFRDFDDEMRRYAEVIHDPGNPVDRLRLITNTDQAADVLAARARDIVGPDVDLRVVVRGD